MADAWTKLGLQIRNTLESVFDNVAASTIVYYDTEGKSYPLTAMVAPENISSKIEGFNASVAGVSDREHLRFAFKTADIASVVKAPLSVAGYFMFNGFRYDFAEKFPGIQSEFTPFKGAVDVFTLVYVRRAEELAHTVAPKATGPKFKVGNW